MTTKLANPELQLRNFIGKFEPKHQRLIRSVRQALRRKFPTLHELVYDNYNFFVIGYCSTERPSDCIFSIAAASSGMGLCFTHGASFPDPKRILVGSGKQTRFLRIESAAVLDRAEVKALIKVAMAQAKRPVPSTGRGRLIIRSVSAKTLPATKGRLTRCSRQDSRRGEKGPRGIQFLVIAAARTAFSCLHGVAQFGTVN